MFINYVMVFLLEGVEAFGMKRYAGKYDEYTLLSAMARSNDFGLVVRNAFDTDPDWTIYVDRHNEGVVMPNGDVVFVGDQVQATQAEPATKTNLDTEHKEVAVLSIKQVKEQIPALVKKTSGYLGGGFVAATGLVLLDGFFFGIWVHNPVSQVVIILAMILISVMICDDLTQRFVAYNMNKHFTFIIIIALAAAQNVAVSNVGWVQDSSQIDKSQDIFPLASLVILLGVVSTILIKMDLYFSPEKSIFRSNNTGLTRVSMDKIVNGNFDALEVTELAALIDYFAVRVEGKDDTDNVSKYSLKKLWIDHRMAAMGSLQDGDIAKFLDWYQRRLSSLA